MNENYDPVAYEQLISEQRARFPPLTVCSEYAEQIETNAMMLLIKLARYKFAARLLKKTDNVLEVGSGCGLGATFLSQHAAHVTGLEIEEHDYTAAREMNRRDNITYLHQSIFDYSPKNQHDAVISLDVIEHLTEADGRKFVNRLSQLCAPDGFVVIGTPSIYSFPYQSKYSQVNHIKCYDQAELVNLMSESFGRCFAFSMNDEVVHTGHPKMAWYYLVMGVNPRAA